MERAPPEAPLLDPVTNRRQSKSFWGLTWGSPARGQDVLKVGAALNAAHTCRVPAKSKERARVQQGRLWGPGARPARHIPPAAEQLGTAHPGVPGLQQSIIPTCREVDTVLRAVPSAARPLFSRGGSSEGAQVGARHKDKIKVPLFARFAELKEERPQAAPGGEKGQAERPQQSMGLEPALTGV